MKDVYLTQIYKFKGPGMKKMRANNGTLRRKNPPNRPAPSGPPPGQGAPPIPTSSRPGEFCFSAQKYWALLI